jgi:hypothetical protein
MLYSTDLSRRDARIDLLRGMALLVIFSDHVVGNPISNFLPYTLCFWDMSELFVYLSGFVCGLSYYRSLEKSGFRKTQEKAMWRWLQIYLAHVISLLIHLAILSFLALYINGQHTVTFSRYWEFERDPMSFILGIFALRQRVSYFDILPLYLVLIPFLPAMMYLRFKSILLSLILCLSVYSFGFTAASQTVTSAWIWTFNPLCWQLLFFGSAFIATSPSFQYFVAYRSGYVLLLSVVVFQALCFLRLTADSHSVLTDRGLLGPIRLVHFAAFMLILVNVAHRDFRPEQYRWLRPILVCGRNSLLTYCVGSVLANIVMLIPRSEQTQVLWAVSVNVIGWCGCITAAYFASSLKSNYGKSRRSTVAQ